MCYHVLPCQIWYSSVSKGVCVNRREPQKCVTDGARPLAEEAWFTPKYKPLPMCYHVKFGIVLRQKVYAEKERNPPPKKKVSAGATPLSFYFIYLFICP